MKEPKSKNPLLGFKIFSYAVAIFFSILILYPLLYILANAMKDSSSIYNVPPSILPDQAQALDVYVDYSSLSHLTQEELLPLLQQDHVLVTMGLVADSNLAKESVFEISFYAMMGEKTIYSARSHRTLLDLEKDNGILNGVFVSQKTLTHGDRVENLSGALGFDFNLEGLSKGGNLGDINEEPVALMAGEVLASGYELAGTYLGTAQSSNPLLLLESFIHYAKLPSYIYSRNEVIAKYSFGAFFFNTIVVIGFAILSQTTLCALTAFSLSKLLPPRVANGMLLFFLGSTMIPFVAIMVSQLEMFISMGLYDNYAAILLPHLLPYGFFVYLYKGFFDNLPPSLFEAARIDGANDFFLFTNICMPLSKPIIAVIALQTFLSNWNDFFWAWLVTERQELWTLNVALYNISKVTSVKPNFTMGLSVLTIIPVLILTIAFSNQIKDNIASVGVKG